MRKIILVTTFILALANLNGQNKDFNQNFLEANTLIEEKQYNIALSIWLNLQAEQPSNFNVNYKVGLCYIHSANNKKKALKYLTTAVQNTSPNYDPFSYSEKRAPIESYYYLAKAYHLNYEFDKALLNYNSFKAKISKKHYLFNMVDFNIKQSKVAKMVVANPVNIKISNVGEIINGVSGDYSPIISTDETSLYFTSRRARKDSSNYYVKDNEDGKHYEDIYVSHNHNGTWTEPELLGINTEGHEATVNISTDGQTLFIYKDDNGNGNIYTSTLESGEWGTLIKLGSDINLKSYETHAHTTPDGNVLYFISDRKKGFGGKDIYLCKKLPNGEWAKAQNAGSVLNTPYDEDGVFMHPDGKTMYFSSQGHSSIGGFDIFSSTIDDAGNWSKPINMGYPVNTTDDDVFFVTSANSKRGYYSSFQESGYGEKDIYVLSLEDADAIPLTLLTAFIKIKGQKGYPENARITVTNNETDERPKEYLPRKKDGKFTIILTPGNDYHIVYSADNHIQEEDLYIPFTSTYQEINKGINLDSVIFENPKDVITENKDKNNSPLDKLKTKISTLELQIENLKNQLAENTTSKEPSTNNIESTDFEAIIDSLKKQIEAKNTVNTNYFESGNIVASYQEYFDYNIKSINTFNAKYIKMINKAAEIAKLNGNVSIQIESSASHVPTETYKTNGNLSSKRAVDAAENIINSLINKGVSKENIIISSTNSSVGGPKYNSDFHNTSIYEKYQYVIIKIKEH